MEYMTIQVASEKWGIGERRIRTLCAESRIDGVIWFGRFWTISENGKEQLDEFFSNVTMFYHDNNLLISDWRAIYDYLCSLPGIEKVMRKNKEASVKFLKDRVTESEPFYISKSTGVFVAQNKIW